MSDKFDVFREEYGPKGKPGETVFDEVIRAWNIVVKGFLDNGYKIGTVDGGAHVNYAANYLGHICGGDVDAAVDALWGLNDDKLYSKGLTMMMEALGAYVVDNAGYMGQKNDDDMWNYCSEDDFDGLWPEEEEESSVWTGEVWAVYDPF